MAKPEKSSSSASKDTHAGNAKQLKTHKAGNIASIIVGILSVFFAFVIILYFFSYRQHPCHHSHP